MAEDKAPGTAVAIAGSRLVRTESGTERARMEFADLADAVVTAEETGYDAVFIPDHGVWEPFSLLASFAQRTSRIALGPGVVTVDSRDPEAMATAAETLHEVSDGRAILGLGAGRIRDVDRVESYVTEVRDLLGPRDLPVYLAALGERMAEVAGRAADGVLLNWCTPERVARAAKEVARDRTEGDPGSVAVYVRACLGHDEEHALAALKEATGMYAALPDYSRQLGTMGLAEEAAAAAEAHRGGRPQDVPESLVRALCVWGTREEALERLQEYREAGADVVIVYPVTAQDPVSSLIGTIMAAAPDPAVEN